MYFKQADLGKRVAELRRTNHMTQEDLAEKAEVNKLHISRIERGITACSIDLLLEMAEALQVSTDFLLQAKTQKERLHERN